MQYLLSLSPKNNSTWTAINHSIIALSLDAYTYVRPSHTPHSVSPLLQPDTPEEVDDHRHNLRSSHPDHPARNRWWDKPLNLIVESNSRAGAIGEHSPCDALVPSIVTEYAVVQSIDDEVFGGPIDLEKSLEGITTEGWRRLDWVTDDHIERECVEAGKRAKILADDSDDSALWFNAYGAEWIKNVGESLISYVRLYLLIMSVFLARQSPDAYIQMALQLAWYRTRGTVTATYETVLTRLFHHGRTETIRSLSTDSRAFVLAMADPSSTVSKSHTRHAFRDAHYCIFI